MLYLPPSGPILLSGSTVFESAADGDQVATLSLAAAGFSCAGSCELQVTALDTAELIFSEAQEHERSDCRRIGGLHSS